MIHKWMEESYDTFLFLIVLVGAVLFFVFYWKGEYQVRYAEVIMQDFLNDVAVDGKITVEKQEELIYHLKRINSGYLVEVRCTEYMSQPVYALIPEKTVKEYYAGRNIPKVQSFSEYEVVLEEEPIELLHLQQETNAAILAAEQKDYLALPKEDTVWKAEALSVYQEVYEGEELITLCRVESPSGNYYAEAEAMRAEVSGMVFLKLMTAGEQHLIPVEVVCYPRMVVCSNGHEVVNSVEVIEESRKKGEVACPYCALLPQKIVCNTTVLSKKAGEGLKKEEVWITVTYLDGHVEKITAESEEWQDSFDENYCGIQQVQIYYRGAMEYITVISENEGCKNCGGECNARYYTDYKRFPYCVECISKVPLFTGKIYEEETVLTNKELFSSLDYFGERNLRRGDFVTVYLSERGKPVTILQKKILQDGKGR